MANFVSSNRQIVGVSVTPSIGVEVALMDKKSPTILKYGKRPIEYNLATREIQDYDAFKATIVDLFKELDINLKSSIYLTLPNVHLDFENLPLIIGDDAISNAILSKAEDSYIFKRVEPVSAWSDLAVNSQTDKRLIVYTSFQETAINQIREIFQELGADLIGIESSYSAIIRGLYFNNVVDLSKNENENWNLLLVNSNSYALFSMQGTRLIDYTEVPLAIKSFSYEEAYQAISTSVSQILPNFPARKLIILSQAEDICSEVLKTQITFDEEIITHDCNKYSKVPPISISTSVMQSEAASMTYALIGALATDHLEEKILDLNLFNKISSISEGYFSFEAFDQTIVVTQELARKALLAIAGGLVLFFAILYGIFYLIDMGFSKQTKGYQAKINTTQNQIEAITGKDGIIDIETLVTKVIDTNKNAISFYDSIATDIPQSVWLQYYYNKNGDKLAIEGVSANIADIYNYYKSLKVISPNSSIKLNRLQILTEINGQDYDLAAPDLGSKYYDFEISNVKSPRSGLLNKDANAQDGQQNPENQNKNNQQGDSAPANNLVPVDINN